MKIVIIGSGNVAAVLGRKIKEAGHQIIQVVSRNTTAASALAYDWDTESTNYFSLVNRNADIYLIAVSDDAIEEVISDIHLPGKVVAHTAASVSKDLLKSVTDDYGVFYPLQSLRKELEEVPPIPLFIDAASSKARMALEALAQSISPQQVAGAGEEERLKLHVAAVVVSNFTNYLYQLAEDYCRRENLDFQLLIPLIEESAHRLRAASPAALQTGPAIRNDRETLEKHLSLLENHPRLKEVYSFLSSAIAGK